MIPKWWKAWRKRIAEEKAGWAKLHSVVDALAPNGGPTIITRFGTIESRLDQVVEQHAAIGTQLQRIIGIQDLSLEHQDQAVMLADPSGEITKATPLLVKWVGRPMEDVLKRGWISFVAFSDRGRVITEYNNAITDCRSLDVCFDVVTGQQPAFPVRLVMQPVEPAKAHGFFIRVFRTDLEHRDVIDKLRGDVSKLANDVHQLADQHSRNHPHVEDRVHRLEELESLRDSRLVQIEQSIKRVRE